mgnify:CR=1 FL=1
MKAKKILLCAVSLVLLLLIVVRIVHVNTNVLTIPEERYAQNQWVELNGAFQEMDDENTEGYSVRILGAEQLTYNEFLEKYGASENPPEGKDDIETVLDVEYEFRNVGNSDGYLLLIQYMIAGPYYSLRPCGLYARRPARDNSQPPCRKIPRIPSMSRTFLPAVFLKTWRAKSSPQSFHASLSKK